MSSDVKTIWVNNLKKPASYDTDFQNTSAKITRLVEDPAIKKRIEFDEISLQEDQHVPNLEASYPVYTVLGSDYPIIRINDALIAKADIGEMVVSSEGFVPTISLTLNFKTTEFMNRHMPKDGDMISTYMQVNTKALNYLRNDFIVTSCSSNIKKGKQSNTVFLEGKMFIPKIYSMQPTFAVIGTSKDVFKEVAKEYGLGFAYNDPEDTNDYMDWICCKRKLPDFLNDVISHSWKDGIDFYKTWIDLYYNVCFVNMNKFLLSSESTEDDLDYTFRTIVTDFYETQKDKTTENPEKIIKIFSNEDSFKDSPFYIKNWKPINNSSDISLSYGYESDSFAFVHNQKVYEEDSENCFNVSQNVPNFDENKVNDHIILRGRGKWEEGKNPVDDLRRVNYDFVNQYITSTWCGVEYVMSEEDAKNKDNTQWAGNVHPNYPHAPYHNKINNMELNKMYIEIECPGLCLQVMRGEKIPVYIIYQTTMDAAINRAEKNQDVYSKTNKFYSGFYIVDSISYVYKTKKDAFSNYTTKMVLKRREWPTPEPVQGEDLYDMTEESV